MGSPKAKPFLIEADKKEKLIILVHGFTDSPGNLKEVALRLKEKGVSCYGVLLPGHGTCHKDLEKFTPKDFFSHLEKIYLKYSKLYKEVYVVGLSLGGNLAIELALKYPEISGIACIGTPVWVKSHKFVKFFSPIVLPVYKYRKRKYPSPSIRKKFLENGSYEYFPLKTVIPVVDYIEGSRSKLKDLKTPVIIVSPRNKNHTKETSGKYLFKNIASEKKKIIDVYDYYYKKSQERIFNKVLDFFEELSRENKAVTLGDLFLNVADRFSENTALLYKKGHHYSEVSFKDLKKNVLKLAGTLQKRGIKKGDNVVIISKNRPEWIMSDLAAQALGAVTVPVHQVLSAVQMNEIIKEVKPKVVFACSEEVVRKLNEGQKKISYELITFDNLKKSFPKKTVFFKDFIEKEKPLNEKENVKETDLASIIYTSGTTGNFAGVKLTNKNFISNIRAIKERIPLYETDRLLSILPLSHVFERTAGYYVPLFSGASISYIEDPQKLAEVAQEEKPTIILAVPRLYEKIYDKVLADVKKSPVKEKLFNWALEAGREYKLNSNQAYALKYKIADKLVFSKVKKKFGNNVRFFVSGAAALPKNVFEFFFSMGWKILEGYGLTETSPVVACNRLDNCKMGSVGLPLRGIEVKIKGGEILVKGPNVTEGYLNALKTKTSFSKDGYFQTGDLGYLDKEGFLFINGRIKEIIVLSTGKNVSPLVLEEALEGSPYILQAMIIGDHKKHVSGLIVPDKEALKAEGLDKNKYEDFLNKEVKRIMKHFAPYERVEKFVLISEPFSVENGLLTPTLKIRRHLVVEKYLSEIEILYS